MDHAPLAHPKKLHREIIAQLTDIIANYVMKKLTSVVYNYFRHLAEITIDAARQQSGKALGHRPTIPNQNQQQRQW
jgi:hypothetical protein